MALVVATTDSPRQHMPSAGSTLSNLARHIDFPKHSANALWTLACEEFATIADTFPDIDADSLEMQLVVWHIYVVAEHVDVAMLLWDGAWLVTRDAENDRGCIV